MGRGKKKDSNLKNKAETMEGVEPSTSQHSNMDVDPSTPRRQPPVPVSSEPIEENKEEEPEGLGLGLGSKTKKNRPKKKKADKVAAETPSEQSIINQPVALGPSLVPAGPPGFPALGFPSLGSRSGPPGAAFVPTQFTTGPDSSAGQWRQRPTTVPQPMSIDPLPQSRPSSTLSREGPGQSQGDGNGRGRGRGRGGGASSYSGPSRSVPMQVDTIPESTRQLKPLKPSRSEVSCRYRIPDKYSGGAVRVQLVKILVNYLPMKFQAIKIYRYDVSFKPDRPKKLIKVAFKIVMNKHFPKEFIAFDQTKNCYSLRELECVPNDGRKEFVVEIPDTNNKMMTFIVSFKLTGIVDLGKIKDHMESQGSSLSAPYEEIQCVDVILRQGALDSYVKSGRQFFKRPKNPIDLTGGLEMWTGLFQSAIFTSCAYINVDVAHKGFAINQPVVSAMVNNFRLALDRPLEAQRGREVENFKNFIKGLRVVATVVNTDNTTQVREFTVIGILGQPKELFFDTPEKQLSVFDYYTKEKKYRLKYPNLNCAWVGSRSKTIYYPLELLEIAPGQPINKQLNEQQVSNMVRQASTPPDVRKSKIDEVAKSMNYSKNVFFKKFGLEISDNFLEVNAKVIEPPKLQVGESRPVLPRRGVWQINKLHKPEALSSWGFLAVECDFHPTAFENLKALLTDCGRQMGMRVSPPKMIEFNRRLTDVRNILGRATDLGVTFMIIVINGFSRDVYHRVKQLAEREVGILTQCIKDSTISRRMNPQTIKNVLLKLNAKLMGVNHLVDPHSMPRCISEGEVMVVGADVTHPSPDQSNVPSIATVTASLDRGCFTYNIEMSIQTPKKEVIVDLEEMMCDHLRVYIERNKSIPKKIYMFRDGVSEGQFAEVLNCELSAIHNAYERFTRSQKPEVLFMLVQKRHHTRLFLSNNAANVEPGTVVDTHIVHPKELDFYLVSHQAVKGTARPSRYHAVCNDGKLPYDEVEQLTYYLCHLYSRCSRSVSYPAPTYYAHLACLRARSLTHGQTFDKAQLEKKPQRLRVLDKILGLSRMFFV